MNETKTKTSVGDSIRQGGCGREGRNRIRPVNDNVFVIVKIISLGKDKNKEED